MSFLRHWKERKWNNKGSSLALVIMIMAIIAILAAVMLSVSLVTFRMKKTYMNSQKNFYDAESVVDDIRAGLQQVVADSAGNAYAWTLENYSDVDESVRKQTYLERYEKEILNRIADSSHTGAYSLRYDTYVLEKLVSQEVWNGAANANFKSRGEVKPPAENPVPLISSADNSCALNRDLDTGTFTLKNLKVTYIDSRDYTTEIRTDIVLSCPKIDFTQKDASVLDLTSYVFIANDRTKVTGGVIDVTGNAYLGNAGTDFSVGSVDFTPTNINAGAKLVTAGQLFARNGAKVSIHPGYSLWAREIYLDSAKSLSAAGNVYLNDDLIVSNSIGVSEVKVDLKGRFYAYGNAQTAGTANVFSDASLMDDLLAHPANYSSAVLINGRNATLDLSGLDDLIIAGNAYINADAEKDGNTDVAMGESIALKAGQRAYLVPPEFIAPFSEKAGGMNPMSADAYEMLQEDLVAQIDAYTDKSQIAMLDYLRVAPTALPEIPSELEKLGVTGIRREVYQMKTRTGAVNMVYFFLVFENETAAVNFSGSYYAKEQNLSAIQARVETAHYNTKIQYPSDLYRELEGEPKEEIDDFRFYYNGGMLMPANAEQLNTAVVSGKCTKLSPQSELELRTLTNKYQDMFAALRHTLMEDYARLTPTEKVNDIYHNLVVPMANANLDRNISPGMKRVFATEVDGVAEESQMCAVVVNGDYTLHKADTDLVATETCGAKNLPIRLVIASGNVLVDCDFKGLIIAGGMLSFSNKNIQVAADSNLAQQALRIEDANGIRPVDYLIDGEKYLSDASGDSADKYGQISFSDYVVFQNWVKQ